MENNNVNNDKIEEVEPILDQPETKKNTVKNKKKTIILASFVTLLSIVLIAVLLVVFVFNYTFPTYLLTYRNISDLKEIEYSFSDDYSKITNIPYDNYLSEVSYKEKDATYISSLTSLNDDPNNNGIILNALIKNIADNSGGVIVFDVNVTTMPICLRDDITIVINENIIVSLPEYEYLMANNLTYSSNAALFYANDAEDINIYGPGTINVNGTSYTKDSLTNSPLLNNSFSLATTTKEIENRTRYAKFEKIPGAISFNDCDSVVIKNIRIIDSASDAIYINDCEYIDIKSTIIENNIFVDNANGIKMLDCQNITIDHCFVVANENGVILSTAKDIAKNIKVNKCVIVALHNSFKIGDKTGKDISHITVTNNYFVMPKIDAGLVGISIESIDGANINDVYVDNIEMNGIATPLLVWLGNRLEVSNGSIGRVGSIKNVSVSNIKCVDVDMPIVLTGLKTDKASYFIQDVRLANFDVKYKQRSESLNVGNAKMEANMSGIPSISNVIRDQSETIYDYPVYGIFARHVKGLKVIKCKIEKREGTTLKQDNITTEQDRYNTEKVFLR